MVSALNLMLFVRNVSSNPVTGSTNSILLISIGYHLLVCHLFNFTSSSFLTVFESNRSRGPRSILGIPFPAVLEHQIVRSWQTMVPRDVLGIVVGR